MSAITKVSEITTAALAEYLRLEETDENDLEMLATLFGVAKAYVVNYTGRSEDDLDNFSDIVIAIYILVQDMWDNRALYVDKTNLNTTVESILGLHAINLLPEAEDNDE